jgi:mevalonate pyrophosphate decarboxylase
MSKSRTKNSKNWNVSVIKALATKYDFSTRYIKQIINNDRSPIFNDRIKKEYEQLDNEMKALLNNQII